MAEVKEKRTRIFDAPASDTPSEIHCNDLNSV
ncbi:hypothetical protein EMIT0373P_10534 [Pseudomonas chlororaphis]